MRMRDNDLLQKLKDNAFYIALGLGLIAVLAVVAIYTVEQGGVNLSENRLDLKQASDYTPMLPVEDVDGSVTRNDSVPRSTAQRVPEDNRTDSAAARLEKKTEPVTTQEKTEEKKTEEKTAEASVPEQESVAVAADAGELNFTSDKTIGWPVQGKVVIPYSMETTVYFETLDQYQCSPAMMISAGKGTTVKNAFLGKVTKITSDDTYGNMVTLYIGNDYSIVYGQLDTIYVNEGDFVKAGESIGTVGTPTDTFEKEGSHLYLQMLQKEQPVDPLLYME